MKGSLSLGAKLKEAILHTIIYGIGSTLQTALGFILIPLYTRHFTADLYGAFSLITLCGAIAGGFFYFGGSSALSRWYYDYEGENRRRAVSTAFLMTLLGVVLQSSLGFLAGGMLSRLLFDHEGYSLHISLMMVTSAVTFLNGLLLMVLRFERRSVLVVLLNLMVVVVSAVLIYVLLVPFDMGIMAPVLGMLLVQGTLTLLLLISARSALAMSILPGQLGGMLRFGINSSFLGLIYYGIDWMDRIVLKEFATLTDVGIYSLAVRLASLIQIVFIMAFAQIWQPMRMQYRADDNADAMLRLALTYYFLAGLTATVVLSVFAPETLGLIGGHEEYRAGARLIPWITLAYLFYGTINILDFGLFVSKKIHYQVGSFALCAVLNLCLLTLLVPAYGAFGASIARMVSFFIVAVFTLRLSQRFLPVDYEYGRVLTLIVFAVGVISASMYLEPVVAGPYKVLYILLFIILVIMFVLRSSERQAAMSHIRRVFRAS